MTKIDLSDIERITRFWNKIDIKSSDLCWEWKAYKNKAGYGRFAVGNKKTPQLSHRLAWIYHYNIEEIPNNLCVLHKCDNPACCNPNHLFLGTQKENIKDMIDKNRFSPGHLPGEKNGNSKLKPEQVIQIRNLFLTGETQRKIAKIFGISPYVAWAIKKRKIWKHLD